MPKERIEPPKVLAAVKPFAARPANFRFQPGRVRHIVSASLLDAYRVAVATRGQTKLNRVHP
jgi:hypothetical protein